MTVTAQAMTAAVSLSETLTTTGPRELSIALLTMSVVLLAAWLFGRWAFAYLERLAQRTRNHIDDAIILMLRSVRPPFYWYLALYAGLSTLDISTTVQTVLNTILLAAVLYQAIRAGGIVIDMQLSRKNARTHERAARRFLGSFIKAGLWLAAALLLLENMGVNVTSLIAGLGIGGIAIAFAMQNVLSDLFSSFAIYLDRPFEVDDFVIVGEHQGTVVRIGLRTTRIRSLDGEEIVIPNRELTATRVRNFAKMKERRVILTFGIEYSTPYPVIETLPHKIRTVLETVGGIRLDRVHFKQFGASSLDFEAVYFVGTNDYTVYMDKQQLVNFAVMELLKKEGVAFAFPTQTVHLAK